MKTIGLIGGMSWQSTVEYYRLINEAIAGKLGGTASAKIIIHSVNFHEIEERQESGHWDELGDIMADIARRLEDHGADAVMIGANTMHKLAPQVEAAVEIPLIHIADACAQAMRRSGIKRAGLLGTRYTMEQDFYRDRIADKYGIDVVIPDADDRTIIHDIIYSELVSGVIRDESRQAYRQVMEHLGEDSAEGIILGCTEIPLLISSEDSSLPVFDTTALHVQAAVDFALN